MNPYKIIVSETFHRDLENIISYISDQLDAPFTATSFLDEVEEKVKGLSDLPYRFELVSDAYLRYKEFRKCLVKNYIIFYQVREKDHMVLIHRILHSKQNWMDIL